MNSNKKGSAETKLELSENERDLLCFLCSQEEGTYDCITRLTGFNVFVIIPKPGFKWDYNAQTPRVQHPECLEKLVKKGYMVFGRHKRQDSYTNYVYILTHEGMEVGSKLLSESRL